MIRALLSLSAGTGAASIVAIESLLALQGGVPELGPEALVSGQFVIQVGLLIASGGFLVLAGKMLGAWQEAQKTLISEVAKIEPLIERVSKLEGIVEMMNERHRRFDITGEEADTA